MPNPKQDLEKRFWQKVKKSSGCWSWTAAIFTWGYGAFQVEGKAMRAHRVSWVLAYGPVPDGLCVLHKCDNPACVRPDHLFLGTTADNMKDRDLKGRNAHGARHGSVLHPGRLPCGDAHYSKTRPELVPRGDRSGRSKLTEALVARIRSEHIPYKVSYAALAKKYGVHAETIGRVVRGDFWKETC